MLSNGKSKLKRTNNNFNVTKNVSSAQQKVTDVLINVNQAVVG
jgi:hypothetical protein